VLVLDKSYLILKKVSD